MSRAHPIQTSFNGGEMSPEMDGRVDLAKYAASAHVMENFMPLIQGPAKKRSGTKFINVMNAEFASFFHRFIFSRTQAYILEFGNQILRFHTADGTVTEAGKSITGATNANPCEITVTAHGYSTNDLVFISGVGGMTQINGAFYTITVTSANTFTLKYSASANNVDATGFGAYTSGGTAARVYQIATPWLGTYLRENSSFNGTPFMDFTQSGDIIYITNKTGVVAPQKLSRFGNNNWTLTEFLPTTGPFESLDPDNTITIYSNVRTGTATLTASAAVFDSLWVGTLLLLEQKSIDDVKQWEPGKTVSANDIRRSDGKNYRAVANGTTGTIRPTHNEGTKYDGDAGVQWEYRDPGFGILKITEFTSSTQVTADVIKPIPDGAVGVANASLRWARGEWRAGKYPTHVTFFRERLTFARASDQRLWFSVAGDFENFSERDDGGLVTPDMSATIDISTDQANRIQWLAPADALIVGTESAEFVVREITTNDVFGPGNIKATPQTYNGSSSVTPIRIGTATFFVQGSGRKVRELSYSIERDGLASIDMTRLHPRIVPRANRIIQMAYQQEPHSIIWAVRDDGALIAFTYNREEEVFGWHRHPIGGSGKVVSVQVIPNAAGGDDEVWLGVERKTVGSGLTRRYIEKLQPDWDSSLAIDDAFYVDSGVVYSGAPADEILGLDHLNTFTVNILADGAVHPPLVVTGGKITLNDNYSKVAIGLPYTAKLATKRIEAGANLGTAQGRTKRLSRVHVRLLDTLGGKMGPNDTTLETILFRKGSDPMDAPPPVFSGDKEVVWRGGYEKEGRMWYVNDQPLPATIVALMPEMETDG